MTSPSDLQAALGLSAEAFRRLVSRCRAWFRDEMIQSGEAEPDLHALIENQPWHGYRLNPTRVRIVARSELDGG